MVAAVLKRIESRLPLDGLAWDTPPGEGEWPEAAVLVALSDEADPSVLLGRRGLHLPLHPGEVAFPGGKREPEDETPWATARREAREEVGLPDSQVTPLGELAPLVTRTGIEVHPCVARVPAVLDLVVDPGEFDNVFREPLATFADPALFRVEEMSDGKHVRRVPVYEVGKDVIWGVTAAVLAQLCNVAYDAGLDLQRDWSVKP